MRECLSNALDRRPTTSHLLSTMERIRTETDGELLQLDIARVKNVRALKEKDKRIEILQVGMLCGIISEFHSMSVIDSIPHKLLVIECSCLYILMQREAAAKDRQTAQKDTQLSQVHEVTLFSLSDNVNFLARLL